MIVIEANYQKKLGLPGYSSHQYSVTIRTELADMNQASEQSEKIHALLQSAVDREIQKTGYLPAPPPEPAQNNGSAPPQDRSAYSNGHHRYHQNGHRNGRINHHNEQWRCSPNQQELIQRIVRENQLDKQQIETLSQELFGVGVRQLNKLQASGLIDELLQQQSDQPANQPTGGRQ